MRIVPLMKAPVRSHASLSPIRRTRAAGNHLRGVSSSPASWCKRRFGLSTAETICILGLMLLLACSWSPALKHLSSSRALNVSGNKIARMLDAARQNAITRQALTALIVLVDGTEEKFRTFTIAERGEDGIWRQITNWEPLAAGITLEVDPQHCTFLDNPLPLPGYKSSQLAYCDRPLTSGEFAYVVFHPDGGLGSSDKTAQLRLVDGTFTNTSSEDSGSLRSPRIKSTKCFDIAIGGDTGIQKLRSN